MTPIVYIDKSYIARPQNVLVTDSWVSAKCSNCGNRRPADQTSCLKCGSTRRDLSVVVNETVHIKARTTRVAVRSQIIKKYFIPSAIATFASAFTGLMTNNLLLGIGIGVALGAASLILGLRASTKIIDRDSSDA
jgi:uncharacterized OB-fold protein